MIHNIGGEDRFYEVTDFMIEYMGLDFMTNMISYDTFKLNLDNIFR